MNLTDRYITNPHPVKEAVQRLFALTLADGKDTAWELAVNNYAALERVKTKTFHLNGSSYNVQFNPARLISSAAKIDSQSIQERECFLCPANLPSQQKAVPFGEHYLILVNPFPIFPRHLTIPDIHHTPQRILSRIEDMLDLAENLSDYIIFYNGPRCGASAPDHMHFQAGNKGFLPLEKEWAQQKTVPIRTHRKATLSYLDNALPATLVIESENKADAADLFHTVYQSMEIKADEEEPMMNLLAWYEGKKGIICIFPREQHRPSCYYAEGEKNRLISPGALDMGRISITALEKDFTQISAKDLSGILTEVCISPEKFRYLKQQLKKNEKQAL